MELEIFAKLNKKFYELEDEVFEMPNRSRYDKIRKDERATYLKGFAAAVKIVESIIEKKHDDMARFYGQEVQDEN